jgi:hypothetical protein
MNYVHISIHMHYLVLKLRSMQCFLSSHWTFVQYLVLQFNNNLSSAQLGP